ncbi:[NiFe] hydrogenase small subunit HydA [Orenia metallireducens]|uniref:[NiFe] hydrogenase small subunit HydA n=1 Tax=Orenia metallireducens TaxID=1413210 RepID=A0A1C0ABJ8_9FIRM|nr:hydrogenase small subunit [Orenia metallireducens]OCL27747.1 [NiFe] hydrogenase small subunit HydA [Orenia metallireducens]
MKISRRRFLQWTAASAAALGLSKFDLERLDNVVLAAGTKPPVIWLQGAACSGCSISLLNSIKETTIDDFLLNKVDMKYHHNLMTATGDLAISTLDQAAIDHNGDFILIIEGGVPTADNGVYCVLTERDGQPWTMLDAVNELGSQAKYVINVGTCAAFGGVPAAGPNPTGIKDVNSILNSNTTNPIINLPGCPTHPYIIMSTVIDLLLNGMPILDYKGRPETFYSNALHDRCPYESGYPEVKELGMEGCYEAIGCRGPETYVNCHTLKWNNEVNWCIQANNLCIGCASETFPQSIFYKIGTSYSEDD